MKLDKFSIPFVFFVLLLSISFASADCKLLGCADGERCMADGLCTTMPVNEYCSGNGFSYSEALVKKNCSMELQIERESLCRQCKGDYEYGQRISEAIGIIFSVGIGIAAIMIVISGLKLISSEDLEERQNSKKAVLFVILGVVILVLARTIIGLLFLPPMMIPPGTSSTTPSGNLTTTIPGVPTTLPSSMCIGFSTCTDCLGKGCKWCNDPILGASICVTKCDDCKTILGTCFDSVCPLTPTTTTITTTTIVTTSTTTTTTLNVPCANLAPPTCNGICQSGEACREISGACGCVTVTTTTTTTTTTVPARVKLTVMFVPVNWVGSLSSFDSAVNAQANEILKNIPLKDCPSSFVVKKATSSCNVGYMSCECPELRTIKSCAQGTGERYDYVVGLHNGDVCGDILGFSCGISAVFSETKVTMVAIHELGHEWGLNDEYVDACRCGYAVDYSANCLDSSIGGSDPARGYTSAYCAGGNRCGGYTVTCQGNRNTEGGRCLMSYGSAQGPRAYCTHCYNQLLEIPRLNC